MWRNRATLEPFGQLHGFDDLFADVRRAEPLEPLLPEKLRNRKQHEESFKKTLVQLLEIEQWKTDSAQQVTEQSPTLSEAIMNKSS